MPDTGGTEIKNCRHGQAAVQAAAVNNRPVPPIRVTRTPGYLHVRSSAAGDRSLTDRASQTTWYDDRLIVVSSPPCHLLERKGVAVRIGESCVFDTTSDLFDRRYIHASAHQFGACPFNIGNDQMESLH